MPAEFSDCRAQTIRGEIHQVEVAHNFFEVAYLDAEPLRLPAGAGYTFIVDCCRLGHNLYPILEGDFCNAATTVIEVVPSPPVTRGRMYSG